MKNIKTILIAVLSFMLLFSVSCKNEDKTGGGSGGVDLGSIPTASGTAADATELTKYSKTYTGTVGSGVTRKSFNSSPQEFGEQFLLEAGNGGLAYVTITDNKISYSGSSGAQVQIYKSADGNSYIASEDIDLDGFKYKSYIQITFKSATEITFYLYTGMTGGPLMTESGTVYDTGGYIAEYEGTLTAQ